MAATPRARHLRKRQFDRMRHQEKIPDFASQRSSDLAATGKEIVFTSNGDNTLTAAANGLVLHEGPFSVSSDTTLPTGLVAGELYWVQSVPDANTFTLTTVRGGPVAAITDAGAGTHTLAKAETGGAFVEYLRQNSPEVVAEAVDVDDL